MQSVTITVSTDMNVTGLQPKEKIQSVFAKMSSPQKTIMTHLEVGTKLDFTSSEGSMKLYFIVLPNSVSALFGSADSVASLSTLLCWETGSLGLKTSKLSETLTSLLTTCYLTYKNLKSLDTSELKISEDFKPTRKIYTKTCTQIKGVK